MRESGNDGNSWDRVLSGSCIGSLGINLNTSKQEENQIKHCMDLFRTENHRRNHLTEVVGAAGYGGAWHLAWWFSDLFWMKKGGGIIWDRWRSKQGRMGVACESKQMKTGGEPMVFLGSSCPTNKAHRVVAICGCFCWGRHLIRECLGFLFNT